MADLSESLQAFVSYVQTHLKGDEKGESADFLDHLFRALGHDGIQQAGAARETRLAKKSGAKGKNFADLMWPERVLIEMKSRGKKLHLHYDQLFDYWTHIVPHRPPFAILCNFDEFWIYDFNIQLFDPVFGFANSHGEPSPNRSLFLLSSHILGEGGFRVQR